jgi:hypothetical protein
MEPKTYFRIVIWAPMLIPLLLLPLLLVPESIPETIAWPLGVVLWSPYVAGIPYVVFAVWTLRRIRLETDAEAYQRLLRAPLAFLPVFGLYYLAVQTMAGLGDSIRGALIELAQALALQLLLILIIGYFYVLIFRWLFLKLVATNSIRSPDSDSWSDLTSASS